MKKIKTLSEKWDTFQGKDVTLDTVDHQHLSNVYWYLKIVNGVKDEDLWQIQETLNDRFNGQLMLYRPHIEYKHEMDYLRDHDYLEQISPNVQVIIYEENIVGEIITIKL